MLYPVAFFAQSTEDTDNPEPPVFTYVTVDSTDGKAVLYWTPSPSTDVSGYFIYIPDTVGVGGGWKCIDTVIGPGADSVKWVNSQANHHSEIYAIAAFDSSGNKSLITPWHCTMYAFPYFDRCQNSTRVVWNRYVGWDSVAYYNVYYKTETSSYALLAQVYSDSSYNQTDMQSDIQYCYYVEAVNGDGRVSLSNLTCIVTNVPHLPKYLVADYATVTGSSQITVAFTIDPNAEINNYKLCRTNPGDGSFYQIATFPANTSNPIIYEDKDLDLNNIYRYKLIANDVCYRDIDTSNEACNIRLSAVSDDDMTLHLQWSLYSNFKGGVKNYNIFRMVDTYPPELVAVLNISDLHIDDVTAFTYSHILEKKYLSGKFCYLVEAVEDSANNPVGMENKSRSNISCDVQPPRVFVPNCIYPNSEIEKNRVFLPYVTFGSLDYALTIYNRWGEKIFETTDTYCGWNGKVKGGNFAPSGIYVYYITFTTSDGKPYKKCGEFLLYYP
ncbi:MAG: gliding motility-associated C-terminal domain-containing protein [Bacteroidia bacterium]|nr:gliding motility-associated C-terminal domain-containing protein [Bacteroidia bacterium]